MAYYSDYHNQQAWNSEYDSTWDEEEETEQPEEIKKVKNSNQYNPQSRAAKDMQNYRHGYLDKSKMPNLRFYQNKIPFEPYGAYIDVMHEYWHNDYHRLEENHNFIQWLFPLQEKGVNRQATPLTLSEIQLMKMDKQVMKRLLKSYKLMLGFYGIELLNEDTGEVARADKNWKGRFDNLNYNTHNNLRITRILKCLGEMGYEKFQVPLVMFFLKETLCYGNLQNVKKSALDYFMFTVKDKEERRKLVHFAWVHYKPQEEFIWGPVEKLKKMNTVPINEAGMQEPEKQEVQVITSNGSSETQRDVPHGLIRKATAWPFLFILRLLSIPFMTFFGMWPFRLVRGYIPWFKGEARNGDRLNEEFSVKTEGTGTENMATANISVESKDSSQEVMESQHQRLLKTPKMQESHKALKEMNVSASEKNNSLDEMKKGTKLRTDNKSEHQSVPEDGTGSEHRKHKNKKIPENRQGKEDDNTKNKDNLGNLTKDIQRNMKNEEQFSAKTEGARTEKTKNANMATANISVEDDASSQGLMESEHESLLITPKGQESNKTKLKEPDVTANEKSDNSLDEMEKGTKLGTEDNKSKPESVSEVGTGSGESKPMVNTKMAESRQDNKDDNNAENKDNLGNLTKNCESKNVMKSAEDLYPRNERLQRTQVGSAKVDDIENGENSAEPAKDIRTDNGGEDRADAENQSEKTEDEGASSVERVQLSSGEEDVAESAKTSTIEDNREETTVGSKDNDVGNIAPLNTEPEKEKTKQVERVDHSRADVYPTFETEKGLNETQPEDGSEETVCHETFNKQEESMEPEPDRLLQGPESQSADGKSDNSLDAKLETEDIGSEHRSVPEESTGSGDGKPSVNIKMLERKPSKEGNDTENKEDLGNSTKDSQRNNAMKINEQQYVANKALEAAEEGSEKEDDTENGEDSDELTKDNGHENKEDGCISNAGNQLEETELRNGKTEDGVPNVEPDPLSSGERDVAENAKIEGIREAVESKDNDVGNIGLQNTESEREKTEQTESVHHHRAGMYCTVETEKELNETQGSEDGREETVSGERFNKQEESMDPEPDRLLKSPERQSADEKSDNRLDAKSGTEDNGSEHESVPEDGTGSGDGKPTVNIKMPECKQSREGNDTENKEDLGNSTKDNQSNTGMKINKDSNLGEEAAEEGSEEEDNDTENGEDSDELTKDSETDNSRENRENGCIADARNQLEGTKISNGKPENGGITNVKPDLLSSGERDVAENDAKIEGNGEAQRLKDNEVVNIGLQNTGPEREKTEQTESNHQHRAEVNSTLHTEKGLNETQEQVDGSGEAMSSENFNKQEDDGTVENKPKQAAGESENL